MKSSFTGASENLNEVMRRDQQLAQELQSKLNDPQILQQAQELSREWHSGSGLESTQVSSALETIVLKIGRPVLAVLKNRAILQFNDIESQFWKEILTNAQAQLSRGIRSVGRIELENHPSYQWVGTGWMVSDDIMVTNRHVAEIFAKKNGNDFIFRQSSNDQQIIKGSIDFLEEYNYTEDFTFKITCVLHIENDPGPDIAFFKVSSLAGKSLPSPMILATNLPRENTNVAVIGYPARDSRIPDQDLMIKIFGDIYDKKRLSPGKITGVSQSEIHHDCSTLGGNSGSLIMDLDTGEAIGLHFAGRYLQRNYAVPATIILDRLQRIKSGKPSPIENNATLPQPVIPATHTSAIPVKTQNVSFTIPLTITISIGDNQASQTCLNDHGSSAFQTDDEIFIEGKIEDYDDRTGYLENFIPDVIVPLPQLKNVHLKRDLLGFNNQQESILKYRHFSVEMSRSRRMCFYSAVNIDGKTSVGMKRTGWRLDPRIPQEYQIMKECYGNSPKFSRGHMTRREDPIWGSEAEAAQGNSDSMHVTNAVPQMQDMNAGVWLSLENYALHHTREDDMLISVFTGPVLLASDPIRYGIQIPLTFWKIIAFIHEKTKKLCATGYTMSQESYLKNQEFIFGQHNTAQVPIATIESHTGLSFGNLKDVDPLNTGLEAPQLVLENTEDIRFY